MPFDDLRAFLKKLEEEGELVHVAQEVDWNEEMGSWEEQARRTLIACGHLVGAKTKCPN